MCTESNEADCLYENDGDIAWACENCPKSKHTDLHPYTKKLLNNASLQKAGYTLHPNDLALEEWHDLVRVREFLEQENQHQQKRS